jgi:D-3-phosphoglycerate dehydrogenase
MREFKLMKKTAFFVNVSRGGVVNEPEMIEALRGGEILGAGLDVFVLEPPEAGNPLLHMKNVYCSPHVAGVTVESMPKISLHAAIGIDEVLNGKAPSWPVNHLA